MKIKESFKRYIQKVKSLFTGKQLLFSVLFLSSLLLVFPSAALLEETHSEQYGERIANIVKKNTQKKDYLSILVLPKDDIQLPSGFFEANELNGLFRGTNFTFSSTVNADKDRTISIPKLGNDINYSILYANTFSNHEYDGHYRHEYFPLELMFKGNHEVDSTDYSFCYLSVSQANEILKQQSKECNQANYESLLRTKITIKYDDLACTYSIANIYLEQNTFYDGLKSTMGDFIMTYAKHPDGFKKSFTYYLNSKPFQNAYLMKRISSLYSKDNYDFEINSFNLSTDLNDSYVLNFFFQKYPTYKNIISIILITIDCLLFGLSFFFLFYSDQIMTLDLGITYFALALLPHLLFRSIYLVTGNVYLFSNTATIIFFVLLLLYLIFFFAISYLKRRNRINEESD